MAPFSRDGVLWACVGVSLVFVIRSITTELRQIVDLTEIQHPEKEDKIISEGTEEALKLDTLLKLSQSTSYDLRASALRIISERSTRGDTRDLLLLDLASKNKVQQQRALNALNFLVSNHARTRISIDARLTDLSTFTAIVDCLCNLLEDHVENTPTTNSPILPKTRPMGEKSALKILHNLLSPRNIPVALEAGIVSRWLSRYPFPCAKAEPSRRRDVVILMKTWWLDDPVMGTILGVLSGHPDGLKQLRKYELMGSNIIEENDHDDDEARSDVWVVAADQARGSFGTSSQRLQEGSAEEQALRRRRREAMVLSDGRRPIGNDDIIQRPIA
ncbi:uncharacterized protein N7515_009179 [Penicillium bovifimosum]|uniref:Uncharacterized protein n=1 Tax=Penicillium bovifimosum TaxID=126998 RepID=A0A9W9GIS4_9EURO|nr:uncharacterized protein N7515_009179 [Penicillium bovifimosum]KAJ5121218.1 hypothetical protein N7515_009179 [Penicillium bovifimosum]